ncbi:MAG: tetratricopeptide repeat protein [Syntrophales bacterium]|jgi:tetratricopeptide (TPR) repeat protein|nr:tetratricopeptide repeat protein [Syntrophales bacterium]MDY0044597.1 tetratricopeptide repeat protein [Syntrophales bacterium]
MDPLYLKERESFISGASAKIERGFFRQAKTSAHERLARFPGDVDAWLVLAACAVKEEQYSKAQEILQELDIILPGWPHIYECLGDIYSRLHMMPEALGSYEKAISPDNDMRRRITAKISGLDASGEKNEKRDLQYQHTSRAHFHTMTLANLYFSQGHVEKAHRVVTNILKEDPSHREACNLLQRIEKIQLARHGGIIEELNRWLAKLDRTREHHGT